MGELGQDKVRTLLWIAKRTDYFIINYCPIFLRMSIYSLMTMFRRDLGDKVFAQLPQDQVAKLLGTPQ